MIKITQPALSELLSPLPLPAPPPPRPITVQLRSVISDYGGAPALYVVGHADRSHVKVGGVGALRKMENRLKSIATQHGRRVMSAAACRRLGPLPLELLAVVPLDNREGSPLWVGGGVGAPLLGIEHDVRDVVSEKIGPPSWWEWLRVLHPVPDDAWGDVVADGVRVVRARRTDPPDPLGVLATIAGAARADTPSL